MKYEIKSESYSRLAQNALNQVKGSLVLDTDVERFLANEFERLPFSAPARSGIELSWRDFFAALPGCHEQGYMRYLDPKTGSGGLPNEEVAAGLEKLGGLTPEAFERPAELVVCFHFRGEPYLARCRERAAAMGHIRFVEWPDPETLVRYYNAADLFVSAGVSVCETFGRSPVEAMSLAGYPPAVATLWGSLEGRPLADLVADFAATGELPCEPAKEAVAAFYELWFADY